MISANLKVACIMKLLVFERLLLDKGVQFQLIDFSDISLKCKIKVKLYFISDECATLSFTFQ